MMSLRSTFMVLALVGVVAVVVSLLALPARAAAPRTGSGDGDPTPQPGTAATITRTTPAFQYPHPAAPKVGQLMAGAPVVVQARVGDWFEIADKTTPGWVPSDVLAGALDTVPRVAAGGPADTLGPVTSPPSGDAPREAPAAASQPPAGASAQVPLAGQASDAAPSAGPTDAPPTLTPTLIPTPIPGEVAVVPTVPTDDLPGRGQSAVSTRPTTPGTSQQAGPVARVIIVRQCVDVNKNRACDVGEGIAGVVGYVLNARTGEVVGQGISDSRGITQIPITTARSDSLVLNVPFLDDYQPLTGTDGRTQPIIVDNSVGLSGLLP